MCSSVKECLRDRSSFIPLHHWTHHVHYRDKKHLLHAVHGTLVDPSFEALSFLSSISLKLPGTEVFKVHLFLTPKSAFLLNCQSQQLHFSFNLEIFSIFIVLIFTLLSSHSLCKLTCFLIELC